MQLESAAAGEGGRQGEGKQGSRDAGREGVSEEASSARKDDFLCPNSTANEWRESIAHFAISMFHLPFTPLSPPLFLRFESTCANVSSNPINQSLHQPTLITGVTATACIRADDRERERRPQSLLPAFTACESHSRRPSRVRVPALYSLTCVLQGMRRTATCCCPADCLALDVRRSLIVQRRPPPLLLPCLLPAFR